MAACFAPACGPERSANTGVASIGDDHPKSSEKRRAQFISLATRPYIAADGTVTLILTMTNIGSTPVFMEAEALPWNRLEGRRLQVEKDGRPCSVRPLRRSQVQEREWDERLMPGRSMTGYVVAPINESGHFVVRGRTNCTIAIGQVDGAVRTLPLAIGPVEVDIPAKPSRTGPSERQRAAYEEFLARAKDHLVAGDLGAALAECANAEDIHITTQTRELRKQIIDTRQVVELVQEADNAMEEKDYDRASTLYSEAMQIQATEELERKHRRARALILLRLAADDLRKDNAQEAQAKIKQSLWYSETIEAKALLSRLAESKPAPE